MKKILVFVSILSIFLFLGSVSANDFNATTSLEIEDGQIPTSQQDVLTSVNDDDSVLGDGEGSSSELKSVIDSTSYGKTASLDKNYTFSRKDSPIVIERAMTIDGNGNTINGNGANGIFSIPKSQQATFKNINFINSSYFISLVYGASINIINCNFTDSTYYHGAIYGRYGGIVNISDCNFNSNYRAVSANTLIVKNTNFTNHYLIAESGDFENCIFLNNWENFDRNNFVATNCTFYIKKALTPNNFRADRCKFILENSTNAYQLVSPRYVSSELSITNSEIHIKCKSSVLINYNNEKPVDFINNTIIDENEGSNQLFIFNDVNLVNNTISNPNDYITVKGEANYLNLVFLDNKTIEADNCAIVNVDAFDDNWNKVEIFSVYVSVNGGDFEKYSLISNKEFVYIPNAAGKNVISGKASQNSKGFVKTGTVNFKREGYFGPFYVSLNGNDTNDGSFDAPLKTLDMAVYMVNLNNTIGKIIVLDGNHEVGTLNIKKDCEISGMGDATLNVGKGTIRGDFDLTINKIRITNSTSSFIVGFNDIKIINTTFVSNDAGNLISDFKNLTVIDSNFTNNKATCIFQSNPNENQYYGNPPQFPVYPLLIENSIFDKNLDSIKVKGFTDLRIEDSEFSNNLGYSVMLESIKVYNPYSYKYDHTPIIKNSRFINNSKTALSAPIMKVYDSVFENNKNGAISCDLTDYALYPGWGSFITEYFLNQLSDSDNWYYHKIRTCDVYNCNFTNNSASIGGAIATVNNVSAYDCNFINNSAEYGGAIYAHGKVLIEGGEFKGNSAIYGGAIFNHNYQFIHPIVDYYDNYEPHLLDPLVFVRNLTISNSKFVDNNADISGGAILSMGGVISKTEFTNNHAATGGAIYVEEYYNIISDEIPREYFYDLCLIDANNVTKVNGGANYTLKIFSSDFNGNSALYGGGAIASVEINPIIVYKNTFVNNVANYGGAISAENAKVVENEFRLNSANIGASIFTINTTLYGNQFDSNMANYGNIVYIDHITHADSNDLLSASPTDEELSLFDLVSSAEPFDLGYCIEKYNDKNSNVYRYFIPPEPEIYIRFWRDASLGPIESNIFYYINGLNFVQNSQYRTNVADYVKILVAYYGDNKNLSDLIWEFTDGDYLNSNNIIVKDVISKYENGVSGDVVVLENGSIKLMKYAEYITFNAKQNKLGYGYEIIDSNVTKKALNATANIGDEVLFNITCSNRNNEVMKNVSIVESYNKGLIFIGHESSRSWTTKDNKTWYLVGDLDAGENVTIIFKFKVNSTGDLENNVTYFKGEYKIGNSSDSVKVKNPDITVRKNTLNQTVYVGNATMFEIIVENIGNVDLDNVYVIESEYDDGLVYLNYQNSTGKWKYEFKNSKHTFYLTSVLEVGKSASLIVIFNTTKVGNFSNTAIAGFGNKTVNSTNTTEVINNTTEATNETDDSTNSTGNTNDTEDKVVEEIPQKTDEVLNETPVTDINVNLDSNATGNPILALLLLLLVFVVNCGFKREK